MTMTMENSSLLWICRGSHSIHTKVWEEKEIQLNSRERKSYPHYSIDRVLVQVVVI